MCYCLSQNHYYIIKKYYLCTDILYPKTLIASRPVVKLHGFFCCFECKKPSSEAGYVVGETLLNCATDEGNFSNNKL